MIKKTTTTTNRKRKKNKLFETKFFFLNEAIMYEVLKNNRKRKQLIQLHF